jgi:DNA helicase-2/ATP-dependent DNA helicase PcrA
MKSIQPNAMQQRAIEAPEKPLLVLAGPGTGKTLTMVERIAWLLENKKYAADHILAITFTNKAAGEIKERLQLKLGKPATRLRIHTFHSFCLEIIRENHNYFSRSRHFSIADPDYQQAIIRNYLADSKIDDNIIKGILRGISNHKMRGQKLANANMEAIYRHYQQTLLDLNAIDFDDIISLARELLEKKEDVRQQWLERLDAILIDEFQDTDRSQYELIRLMVPANDNIFVVGDDDQSIFAWRGAEPENIKRFIDDFALCEADIILLDRNYRSSGPIYRMAEKPLLATHRLFPAKQIEVTHGEGPEVKVEGFANRQAEAAYLLSDIQTWVNAAPDRHYSDIAIIYPRHSVGTFLERTFLDARLPCRLAAGRSLLDHPSVKKLLAFLRFILNPGDRIALQQIFKLEIAATTFKKLEHDSFRQGQPFRQSLTKALVSPTYNSKEVNEIRHTLARVSNLLTLGQNQGLARIVRELLNNDQQLGISRLQGFRDLLADPLVGENYDNRPARENLKQMLRKHSEMIIASGNHESDTLLQQVVQPLLPATSVLSLAAAAKDPQKRSREAIIVCASEAIEDLPQWAPERRFCLSDNPLPEAGSSTFYSPAKTYPGRLWHLMQCLSHGEQKHDFSDYVILDLETTDRDSRTCEIIEIAAVRVRQGQPTAEYSQLIKPRGEIDVAASEVHGLYREDLSEAPGLEQIWSAFLTFIGNDLLVAHNGANFDFRILNRLQQQLNGEKLLNATFDTLPFARSLLPGKSHSLDALLSHFDLQSSSDRHRALADVMLLQQVFARLQDLQNSLQRRTAHEDAAAAMALAMRNFTGQLSDSEMLLLQVGRQQLLRRRDVHAEKLFALIKNSVKYCLQTLEERIRDHKWQLDEDNGSEKIRELLYLAARMELDHREDKVEAIQAFIQFLSLYSDAQQLDGDIDAVNLLTLHTSKGLEFEKVYIAGLEDKNMPSYWSYQSDSDTDIPVDKKLEEQRRLFYVGMTRARRELTLTYSAVNEQQREERPSPFLLELQG